MNDYFNVRFFIFPCKILSSELATGASLRLDTIAGLLIAYTKPTVLWPTLFGAESADMTQNHRFPAVTAGNPHQNETFCECNVMHKQSLHSRPFSCIYIYIYIYIYSRIRALAHTHTYCDLIAREVERKPPYSARLLSSCCGAVAAALVAGWSWIGRAAEGGRGGCWSARRPRARGMKSVKGPVCLCGRRAGGESFFCELPS